MFFDQTLDQMDASNKKTFKQRYFVNKQWKNSNNGAVHILYVEGEYTASVSKVTNVNLPHVALAKDLGATVWSLEHRWRGKSQPLKRTFAANLRNYLSTQQAIEDIATFIKAQNQASKESNPKWILVGSNYGGSLALWFRLKYPSLTTGVVSDSAPITPTIDFWQYEKFVEEAYSNYSYECWHGIKFAALSVRNEIQYQGGVDRLNDELKLSPPIDDNKVDYKSFQNLHHNLIQLFEVPVVYNQVNVGPFSTCCGIEDVCKIMSNETEKDIERVYLLAKLLYNNIHGSKDAFPGIPNSYEGLVNYLNNTKHDDSDTEQPSARSWLWQQCHEFGQFVTTDNGRGLFAATVPNDYFIGLCTDAFEEKIYSFTVDNLKSGVKNTTLAFDTSKTYKGSNAVIFNGAHDPWSLMGVSAVSDSSSTVVSMEGVGHAAVFQAPSSNDPKVLQNARTNVMAAKVKKWVKGTSNSKSANLNGKQELHTAHIFDTPEEKSASPKSETGLAKLSTLKMVSHQKARLPYCQHPPQRISAPQKAHDLVMKKGNSFAQKMRQRSLSKSLNAPTLNATLHKHYLKTGYIVQDADHFNTGGMQFTQRFFKNDLYQRDRDAIRFLMLGAESAIDYYYVDDEYLQYYRWAKDFKAVLYCLEHRFFGYSAPVENSSVEILSKLLTTEQVLADAAVFIKSMNAADNNTADPRWVIFGGSYGGNLVAAFRLRYPKLSVGGIASSGPLQAKTDFYEYMQKVEKDIKRWGPVYCPSAIRKFFGWIRSSLNTKAGRVMIKEVFCISNHWDENYIDEKDSELFIADMVFGIDGVLQYDSENHNYLNYMCRYYKQFDDALEVKKQDRARKIVQAMHHIKAEIENGGNKIKLGNHVIKADDKDDYYEEDNNYTDYDDDSDTNRYSDSQSGEPEMSCPREYCPYGCYPISYNGMLQYLQNVYRNCWGGSYCDDETRLWFWLSCSQWGYAESTNYGYNYFESGLPINHVLDICTDVFGDQYNRTRIEQGVAATNKMYGGQDNYNGTNCMFINGSEDPWSTLSVYKPLSSTSSSLLIDGTSHCVDMYREYEHDVQVLKMLES
uniref:Uncharacterized protein n=1 Tax=Ditylenchus dipsaci TaxID=166011 RepID=A0A915DQ36_9BILA